LVDVEAVKAAKFKVVVDGVNSSGGIPKLLELIVEVEIIVNPTDIFHTIQSLKKEHLTDISELVVKEKSGFRGCC
jgi:phosphomannomutase